MENGNSLDHHEVDTAPEGNHTETEENNHLQQVSAAGIDAPDSSDTGLEGDSGDQQHVNHVAKLSNIKSKFESFEEPAPASPSRRKEKVYYAGLQSAKHRYETATSEKEKPHSEKPKRFTPPRDGSAGVVESQPQELPPDVVRYYDNGEGDDRPAPGSSRGVLARFKEMEQQSQNGAPPPKDAGAARPRSGSKISSVWERALEDENKRQLNRLDPQQEILAIASQSGNAVYENQPAELPDDVVRCGNYSPADAAAIEQQYTKRLKEKFLLESQQQKTVEKRPIKLDEGEGGVYENEPIQLPDVVRSDAVSDEDYRQYAEGAKVATVAKQKFMSEAAQKAASGGERKVTLELANDSGVYENCPEVRQGVARWGAQDEAAAFDPTGAYSRAMGAWQQNSQGTSGQTGQPRHLDIDPNSGGVFENQPAPLPDGVVRGGGIGAAMEADPAGFAGARTARQQYERSLSNSSAPKPKKPVTLEVGEGGVFENQPEQRLPDLVQQHLNPADEIQNIRGTASAAKRQLLLRQREAEEAAKAGRPGMIDIWAELSEHSGVFENEPQQRPADIVRGGCHDD